MVAKQRILIVDDDENIAELISLYLTKAILKRSGSKSQIPVFRKFFQRTVVYSAK